MSRLIDDDQDELQQRERELTLSTGAILAIFLGLVLLCGVFFGFGYNLGRKATATTNAALPAATNETEPTSNANSTFDNFKPSPSARSTPSSPISAPATSDSTVAKTEPAPAAATESAPETQPAAPVTRTTPPPTAATTAPRAVPVAASTPAPVRPAQPAAPTVAPGGAFVVQIAAISAAHKDDADLLASALHSKGYAVAKRTDTQDKLIHVQVGPFATKADAEAMRERLIVDGYNPIVK